MDLQQLTPLTLGFSKAGAAAGTTTTLSTTATYLYAIAGKAYSKAAITNSATPVVDFATSAAFSSISANQGTIYVFGFDASGTLRAVQGGVSALDVSGNFITAPTMPSMPDNFCPFAYLVAKGGSTLAATWTLGTNNLSGVTGMTYTFQDVIGFPQRPQVS